MQVPDLHAQITSCMHTETHILHKSCTHARVHVVERMINITQAIVVGTTNYNLDLRDEPTEIYDDSKRATLLLPQSGYDDLKELFFNECKTQYLKLEKKMDNELKMADPLQPLSVNMKLQHTISTPIFYQGRTQMHSFEYMDKNEGTRDGCMDVNDRYKRTIQNGLERTRNCACLFLTASRHRREFTQKRRMSCVGTLSSWVYTFACDTHDTVSDTRKQSIQST